MFQLTGDEFDSLRFHFGISNGSRGGRRYLPHAFTEQGVAMLSSVLKSRRAIAVNIAIMRAFVRLRQILATHKDLAERLAEMEKKYDQRFKVVFDAIRKLMSPAPPPPALPPPPAPRKRPIGFLATGAARSACTLQVR